MSFFNLIKIVNYLNFGLLRKIFHFLVYKKILFTDYKNLIFYVQCEQKLFYQVDYILINLKKKKN